jgi:hypothetical protein
MNVFISPMLVLHEFAQDPAMKRRAGMMLDLLLADFAAECLGGAYCGGHSRDYPDDIINPLAAPSTRISWLFFGMPEDENWNDERYRPRHRGSWETVFAALGSYRLPAVVLGMATDRSRPYVHTETKRVRNIIRFGDVKNPPVYKYTYMTADYALGSLQGGILQPIQQHTWDVTFRSGKPNNTLFALHPFVSGNELAMFFPEEVKFLAGEVDRYHLVYTDPGKWNSSSPYEQVRQYKNALIALYRIAPGERQPHIDAFIPKTLDERIIDPSGWIFCRGGTAYIALRPLKPYEWTEEKVNWRLRSSDLTNGIVVEVGSIAEHGSFGRFQERMKTTALRSPRFDEDQRVEFVTTSGDTLRFAYGGEFAVNGRAVDFRSYRLFNGPFISAELGRGVITLKHGHSTRVLDFPRGRVEDRP